MSMFPVAKSSRVATVHYFARRVALSAFLAVLACGLTLAQNKSSSKDKPQPVKAKVQPKGEAPKKDASKIQVRNNAASLLVELLGDEKNVSKLLIIKGNSEELGRMIKTISEAAEDGEKRIEAMAQSDPSLNLKVLQLPPGEQATRDAIRKTKTHDLLFSSGKKFEFNLLLSQTEALNYAWHLAKVASSNAPGPKQEQGFHALEEKFSGLYEQVVAKMSGIPAT